MMKKHSPIIFFILLFTFSSYSTATDIKDLIRLAEQTNSASNWNKVADYYNQRKYQTNKPYNYPNLFIKYSATALERAKKEKNELEQGNAYSHLAEAGLFIMGWEEYIENYTNASLLYTEANNIPLQIKAMSSLGHGYLSVGHAPTAHILFTDALEWSKEVPEERKDNGILFLNLGKSYIYLNQLDSAEYYINLSEKQVIGSLAIKDSDFTTKVLFNKGLLCCKKKEYLPAMIHFNNALKTNDETGKNAMLQSLILNQIALLYASCDKYDFALHYNNQAMQLCLDIQAFVPLESIFNTHIALRCKSYEQEQLAGGKITNIDILTIGTKELSEYRKWFMDDRQALYNNYIQTAILFDLYGTPHACSEYLEKAYKLTENASEILPLGPYLKHKGNTYMKSEQYKQAIVLYELYVDQYINNPRHFLLEAENYEVYENLAACYEKEQEPEKVSEYRQKALTAQKEAISEKKQILTSFFSEEQTPDKENSDARFRKNLRKHLTAVLIISLPFVVWFVFRRKRSKK
ncbi:hypothetical protein [Bacteroides sp. 51]|uniref:tetratricopeptide repeat protein n=1 Tax=Bacteroides sp. 51 TaxID=2302938 RepID=UPI0013D1187B|nr:hypothetical protein [Bacteroides sp. 51]NDV81483.1 hypothetical protein [Bacteroides sp. 51]